MKEFFVLDLLLDVITLGLRSVIWIIGALSLMLLGTFLIGIFILSIVAILAILL